MAISELVVTMIICLFVMGVVSIGAGVYILIVKVAGADIRTLATETAKLAQKGIAEDISGLVGNASALVGSLNDLVKSTSGIGAFMIIIGFVFIGAAYYLIVQLG